METINLDKLYNIYIDENIRINTNKLLVLEAFRDKENNFKKYEDIISLLEKEKIESKIDSYAKLSEEILFKLQQFSPNSIEENLKPVKEEIVKIKEIKEEIAKISDKFRYVENMWLSFLERKDNLDTNAVFVKDIFKSIAELKEEFSIIEINDIGMIEEKIDTLKDSIVKAMSIIEDFTAIIEKNVFIGKEPRDLYNEISFFINTEYKKFTLAEINIKSAELEEKIEQLNIYRIRKRLKAKVIKFKNKSNQSIYNYGIEFRGVTMYPSEKMSDNAVKEDTRKFLYIDNFPVYGIFNINTLNEEIEVADDQFFANKDLNDKSMNLFIVTALITLFIISLDMNPIIKIPLAILMQFVFVFFFKGLMYRINDNYNLKNMFYFFKVSYIYTSIGDNGLEVQKIVPNILLNFDKIIDNELSLASEDHKKETKKEIKEETKEETKKETKKVSTIDNLKEKIKKIVDNINEKDRLKQEEKNKKKESKK